ncbi:TraR/DksA C4-type zinc finger protein [Neobacillus sp. SuZ13]|uniref:TraR/DksA C4-type zinc finger protein n=1 Tax=Neobacillus sp. SuZ13 TaxID=3047875 RepID=UPI0024BF9AC3|nr:TraR/DksA C4-type zinc finger protein [Neobacillus sp. SuZ13]WHY66922.1 TraR/DksA C4-type zinc finger protein [Neobacillus sp. SuZ13]
MLSEKDLMHFKEKLEQIKSDTLQLLASNQPLSFEESGELTSNDNHFADTATELAEREKQMMLIENAKRTLEEVNEALERISNGTYGVCVDTGENISYERLVVLPYAKRTVDAQEKLEKETIPNHEDQSFSTPKDDVRGDKRIQTVDELLYLHGNSSY